MALAQNSSCFPYTTVYGTREEGSTVASDLSYLRSSSFNDQMFVYKIEVCGTSMSFSGIQLFLADGQGNMIRMNEIGTTTPCDTWSLPSNSYFKEITVAYDANGMTYLEARTNKGTTFQRGFLSTSDTKIVE